jgi:AraC-like DNA-binding protein
MQHFFHIEHQFGAYYGNLVDNRAHKHYALQMSLAADSDTLTLTDEHGVSTHAPCFFIHSNVEHLLTCDGMQLTILINPLSASGHFLSVSMAATTVSAPPPTLAEPIQQTLSALKRGQCSFPELFSCIRHVLTEYECRCEEENHWQDERIVRALRYLDAHVERIVPLEEIAEHCFLSETRFLHLFKEKTQMSYRRYQLWNRITRSIPLLHNHSITEVAFQCGFTDSAHYTRTFVETFGVTPKFLRRKQ